MKLLFTTPVLSKQGGVSAMYNVLRPWLGDDADYFTVASRAVRESPVGQARHFVEDAKRFRRQVRVQGYDVVVLNPSFMYVPMIREACFLHAANKAGAKTMVFIHGWSPVFERHARHIFPALLRRLYSKADAFLVLCEDFKRTLRKIGFRQPIYVETTAVEEGLFPASTEEVANANIREPKEFNLLFLSRLAKDKGLYVAIDAFRLVREKHQTARLLVAGRGPEEKQARDYVKNRRIPGVVFEGFVSGEKKRELLRGSNAYILPTTHAEGMPISVLEAMASGLPAIVRPVAGLKDFFKSGEMGFATESREPEAFAELIERLILAPELRQTIARGNYLYAKKRFAASAVADRIRNAAEEIAAAP